MKVYLAIVLALQGLLCTQSMAIADEGTEQILGYVESVRKLHRGPPVPATKGRSFIWTDWIEQKLDHFNNADNRTWEMRYMYNMDFFKAGGPIFIYIGGEWEIGPGMIDAGIIRDLAKKHNGMLYYTEHRYYGESQPTKNLTLSNIQFLHAKQSLADLAHFINQVRTNNPAMANSKVILAGGSYSASMVVWFKRLYPKLIVGGWASSAPLLAKVDFWEYKRMVGHAIRLLGSQKCYNRIENATAVLEQMFNENRAAEAKQLLQICDNFNEHNHLDVWTLFSSLANIFSGIVQTQTGTDVADNCNYLMSFDDDLTGYTKFILKQYNFPNYCINYAYQNTVDFYSDIKPSAEGERSWFYQTCNEFGWFQSSTSNDQPFGYRFPPALEISMCRDVLDKSFSNKINAKVAQTNRDFGGLNPAVKDVYMTHGGLDPWSTVGHGTAQGASVIPLTSHCQDFDSISDDDSDEMRSSKERLFELVAEWLED